MQKVIDKITAKLNEAEMRQDEAFDKWVKSEKDSDKREYLIWQGKEEAYGKALYIVAKYGREL